jgi:flagellar motor switch protein FliN/FliY
MAETIEYEQFEGQSPSGNDASHPDLPPAAASSPQGDLSRLSEIPMELSVEIGRTHMTVGETLDLRVGSVVALERLAGETADLLVNGSAIARGEVVVIDEQYGLRITEILDGQSEAASSPEGEHAAPADVSVAAPAPELASPAPESASPAPQAQPAPVELSRDAASAGED